MRNSDKLRIAWLDREGQHSILTTMCGPFPAYSKWEVRAYTVAIILFAGLMMLIMEVGW